MPTIVTLFDPSSQQQCIYAPICNHIFPNHLSRNPLLLTNLLNCVLLGRKSVFERIIMKKKISIITIILLLLVGFMLFITKKNSSAPSDSTQNVIESAAEEMMTIEEALLDEAASSTINDEISFNESEETSTDASDQVATDALVAADRPQPFMIIIGDSRACSMSNTLSNNSGWTLIQNNKIAPDQGICIFQRGSEKLAVCQYGGGSLQNGAYDKCISWVTELLASEENSNSTYYYIFDIFGLGDVGSGMFADSPNFYNEKNQKFASSLPANAIYYQCNVGPIDENGSIGQSGIWTNAIIKDYNTHFKKSSNVKIFDLYTFLEKVGYGCNITETDPTGVHYNYETDIKIVNKFFSMTENKDYHS